MISGDARLRSYDNDTLTYNNGQPIADRVSFHCIDSSEPNLAERTIHVQDKLRPRHASPDPVPVLLGWRQHLLAELSTRGLPNPDRKWRLSSGSPSRPAAPVLRSLVLDHRHRPICRRRVCLCAGRHHWLRLPRRLHERVEPGRAGKCCGELPLSGQQTPTAPFRHVLLWPLPTTSTTHGPTLNNLPSSRSLSADYWTTSLAATR
jgi:hypothetical protein